MPTKEIARAKYADDQKKIDLEAAWNTTAAWYAKLKLGGLPKPDFDKIRAAMAKSKSDSAFFAKFDGQWLEIGAYASGKQVEFLVTVDLSEGGDQKKWRERMEILKADKLVTDGDLKSFDKKHPDPNKAAEVERDINKAKKRLEIKLMVFRRAAKALKEADAEVKAEQAEVKKLEEEFKQLGGKP